MPKAKAINIIFLGIGSIAVALIIAYQVSIWILVVTFLAYLAFRIYGSIVISSQFFVPVLCNGAGKPQSISITFDDGPLPGKTERILKILREHHVSAAFFCIGNRAEKDPELVKQIHAEGHIVGNHTYTHAPNFSLRSRVAMQNELASTDQVLQKILHLKPRFFRPPYGVINPNLANAIRKGNYITIGWSVRSFDTITKDKANLFKRVTRKLKAGDIILFHDYCESTIEMLPEFLAHATKLGLKVVRVDQLLNESPYA